MQWRTAGQALEAREAGARAARIQLHEDACLEWLWMERCGSDGEHGHCPSCGRRRRFHRVRVRGSYSCDSCGHHLYPRVGTPFERSRLSLSLWFAAVREIERDPGIGADKLAGTLGTTVRTARRVRERICAGRHGPDGDLLHRIAGWVDQRPGESRFALPPDGAQRKPDEGIRATILEATVRAIVRRGYPAVRMSDIAAEAGVSTAAIHYHFGTKDELLFAALTRCLGEWFEALDAVVGSDETPISKLGALLRYAVIDSPDRVDQIVWMELARLALRDPYWAAEMERLCLRWDSRLQHVLQEGVDMGQFTCAGTVEDAVIRIQGLIDGLAERVMLTYNDSPPARVRRLILQMAAREVGVDVSALMVKGQVIPRAAGIRDAALTPAARVMDASGMVRRAGPAPARECGS